jgi:acyl carrier protein
MANEEALRAELKALIVRALRLDGLTSERLTDDSVLFDSVDALELVVALEKAYGITVRSHEVAKDDFTSVRSLARFVARALDGAASPIGQNAT